MREITKRLTDNINRFRNAVHLIPEAVLAEKPRPEKWSRREILGHLIDSAVNNLKRFEDIATGEGPYEVQPYRQDDLVRINRYQDVETAELVILWQSLNTQIVRLIDGLPESAPLREIRVGGESWTLRRLIEDYVVHLEHHLAQILAPGYEPKPVSYHITPQEVFDRLREGTSEFVTLLAYGDLEVEYYRPDRVDRQQPHDKDELYVIASGQGEFIREGERYHVRAHDVLFVPAGEEHRFVNFSDDFATWVVFYGGRRFLAV